MSKPHKLSKQERHYRILDETELSVFVRVSGLAERLGVSTETLRRDLDELSKRGLIERTYGGATTPSFGKVEGINGSTGVRSPVEVATIGIAAAQRVKAGQTVMLSGGEIALHTARELARVSVNLVVITCNARIAATVARNPTIQALLLPGTYDAKQDNVSGEETVGYLREFHADLAIIEAPVLTSEGPFEESSGAATVKRAMLQRALTNLLVVSGPGRWSRAVRKICALECLDEVLVSDRPGKAIAAAARNAGASISTVSFTQTENGNKARPVPVGED